MNLVSRKGLGILPYRTGYLYCTSPWGQMRHIQQKSVFSRTRTWYRG